MFDENRIRFASFQGQISLPVVAILARSFLLSFHTRNSILVALKDQASIVLSRHRINEQRSRGKYRHEATSGVNCRECWQILLRPAATKSLIPYEQKSTVRTVLPSARSIFARFLYPLERGSKASRKPSPRNENESTRVTSTKQGRKGSQGCVLMKGLPSAIMSPMLEPGGRTPKPR